VRRLHPVVPGIEVVGDRTASVVHPLRGVGAAGAAVEFRQKVDSITENVVCVAKQAGTGTLVMGEPGTVRAGVMRSARSAVALEQTVVTAMPTAEPRRAMRTKASGSAPREDSSATATDRNAAPAVPVVVRKVECGSR